MERANSRHPRYGASLGLIATLACLLVAQPSAFGQTKLSDQVKSWRLTEEGVRIDLDLERLRGVVAAELPRLVQQSAGNMFRDLTWGNFRFSNLRPDLDRVEIQATANPHELAVTLQLGIQADRERLRWRWRGFHSRLEWTPDGTKRVASITCRGRIRLAVSADSEVIVSVMADSLAGEILLRPVRGASIGKNLHGRSVSERRIPLLNDLFGGRLEGVRITGMRIVEVTGSLAVIDVLVEATPAPDSDVENDDARNVQQSESGK